MRRSRARWRERARVLPALFFASVWLLGYEVVPFAHQAMHAQLGAHVHGDAAIHCHAGFCHEDDGARPAKRHARHGDGSLEHRGVAALAPALEIHVPELMLAGEMAIEVALAQRVTIFEACSPPVRGPPV